MVYWWIILVLFVLTLPFHIKNLIDEKDFDPVVAVFAKLIDAALMVPILVWSYQWLQSVHG